MTDIVIAGGKRTPMAEYCGTPGFGKLKDFSANDLGGFAILGAACVGTNLDCTPGSLSAGDGLVVSLDAESTRPFELTALEPAKIENERLGRFALWSFRGGEE